MRRTTAIVFSGVALLFYGMGHLLRPDDLPHGALIADLAIAPTAALALFMLALILPGVAGVARLISALWPLVVATALAAGDSAGGRGYFADLGPWPFIAATTAAGLALVPPDGRQLETLALFPFGATLSLFFATVCTIAAPGLAPMILSTPYHFVILLVFGATLVALADAAATTLPAPRERLIRALSAMMPLLGFLGTIAGLLEALANLPDLFAAGGSDSGALALVMRGLSTAFETTLTGLVGAASCSFLLLLLVDREAKRT